MTGPPSYDRDDLEPYLTSDAMTAGQYEEWADRVAATLPLPPPDAINRLRHIFAQPPADFSPSWKCPHCGRRNYHPDDLANHYCGQCHHFCDDES